jgi:uncharacterized membrane protein
MTEQSQPVASLTNEDLEALLQRALRITLILGALAALALWLASGWRSAAMLAAGAAISAASIFEWRRLLRLLNAMLDQKKAPPGTALGALLFVFRLIVFAGVIYGSLKCFRGSVIALLCGLGLAVLALVWEALRLLKN